MGRRSVTAAAAAALLFLTASGVVSGEKNTKSFSLRNKNLEKKKTTLTFPRIVLPPTGENSVHVCCNCGDDASSTPFLRDTPLNTLSRAQDVLREVRKSSTSHNLNSKFTVYISSPDLSAPCSSPRRFTEEDGGVSEETRVTYRSYQGDPPAVISGGVPLYQSALQPVTDPAIIAQIQPSVLPYIQQISLASIGISDFGIQQCHPYMGGEASILPGNLVSAALEVFLYGDPTIGGDMSPLTLARYPNRDHVPKQWAGGNINNYTIYTDALTSPRLPYWASQLQYDPESIYVHYLGGLGWDDHHNLLQSVSVNTSNVSSSCAAASASSASTVNCSNFESGFDYDGNDLQAPIPATSQADCCAKCNSFPGCNYYSYCTNGDCGNTNCYLKSSNSGRKVWVDRLSGPVGPVAPQSSITLAPCASHYQEPGFDSLDNAGTYYAYNVLYELDSEGEFYVNRSSGMLYLWPPSSSNSSYWQMAPWGRPVVGSITGLRHIQGMREEQLTSSKTSASTDTLIGEISTDNILLDFDGTAFITIDSIVLTTARNAGIRAVNTSTITISNSILQNTGSMAVNATGGDNFMILSSVVRHAGNGAIFFYAGNRTTLTKAQHTIANSVVSYSNRYMYCYVPSVALADCGNQIIDSELFGGPHQGTFISGNEHTIAGSVLHDLVEAASDSGTVYMGRDWTYRGNVIANNTFIRINTVNPGDDVSAVYLDDEVSGFTITGNTFVNVSRAVLLGGGRDIFIANNTVSGVDGSDAAVHFDNRGMGWASGSCAAPNGELVQFLNRVPYNTSAIWIASYPHLPNILQDDQCVPKYNTIVDNVYCNVGSTPFIDVDNATIVSWGSTAYGNVAGSSNC